MSLTCEQPDIAGLIVRDGTEIITEIRSLRIILARFRPGGRPLIGPTVPFSLFWMQYANHEDPNRNAGSNASLKILRREPEEIVVECSGTTAAEACTSLFVLTIARTTTPASYLYTIAARLDVVAESGWLVTPNPDHGELEFANLWPEGTFVTDPGVKKRFQSCIFTGSTGTFRVPHNHLESSDKHRIPLAPGDRFLWGLEDENPCLTLESGNEVSAGVCAYMWDAHFAFKVARAGAPVVLPRGATFDAVYKLTCIGRPEADRIAAFAVDRSAPERGPIYVEGVNRFSETLDSLGPAGAYAWPWEKEENEGAALFVDHRHGFDDSASLCITNTTAGRAAWKATALGPAYGQPPFRDGARFRLSAFVKSERLMGKATVVLRLHREGRGSVFEPGTYELFASADLVSGTEGWVRLEVMTPAISPGPDRLHLLLVQEGAGTSWFDNALLEVIE